MLDLVGGFLLALLPALPILFWLRRNNARNLDEAPGGSARTESQSARTDSLSARIEPWSARGESAGRESTPRKSGGMIGRGLLLGFFAVAPAAIVEFFLYYAAAPLVGLGQRLFEAFILAALVEEGLKFAFLKRWLWRRPEFSTATDGIVYAVAVSLGFAVIENFVYTWHRPDLLLIRSLTAVPLHAIATGQLGFWLGLEKMREGGHALATFPKGGWMRGLASAVFVHGSYDFLILGGDWSAFLVLPLLLVAFFLLRRRFAFAGRIDEEAGLSVDSLKRKPS